jgi:hypothetical protein
MCVAVVSRGLALMVDAVGALNDKGGAAAGQAQQLYAFLEFVVFICRFYFVIFIVIVFLRE